MQFLTSFHLLSSLWLKFNSDLCKVIFRYKIYKPCLIFRGPKCQKLENRLMLKTMTCKNVPSSLELLLINSLLHRFGVSVCASDKLTYPKGIHSSAISQLNHSTRRTKRSGAHQCSDLFIFIQKSADKRGIPSACGMTAPILTIHCHCEV